MRPFRDLLTFPMLVALLAGSVVFSADPEPEPTGLSLEIREYCDEIGSLNRDNGFHATSAQLYEYLDLAAELPDRHDLLPLIYVTLAEISFWDGKVKTAFEQVILGAELVRPGTSTNFKIRLVEQAIVLNIFSGHSHEAIGLLDKWKAIGFNDQDLWRQKYLFYSAMASYFVDDDDLFRESLDAIARMTDAEFLIPSISNLWLVETMFYSLDGDPETALEYIEEVRNLPGFREGGGLYHFINSLVLHSNGEPDTVIAESLHKAKIAYESGGRAGLFPLMLSMIMRYHILDQPRGDWLVFHRDMAVYADQDLEPVILAFANLSMSLPELSSSGERERYLARANKKLLFTENLLARLHLKLERTVEANFFEEPEPVDPASGFYITLLILLLIVLLLVTLLRIRTQALINRRLRESVEKSRVAEKAAAHASKLKSEFVSNISHEIKTPMSGLVGMTSILDELIKDPVQRKYLATMRDCSNNLMVLINDLLDLGRIEAGRLEIDETHFSLSSTIEYCRQMVFHEAYSKGLEFNIEKSSAVPDVFIGDATRIGQVIINLLNNAIKFTNKGTVSLIVDFEQTSDEEGKLITTVADTGIGIAPEHLRTVFEPFNQTNRPPGKVETGSGLGLAISKQLTDLMGGTLSVQSEPNVGSKFTMELTLQVAEDQSSFDEA